MKTETAPQKMSGSIPWGWLIALALLITAAGAALWLLPKPTPHTAPAPVVRAKVPPAPPAEPTPAPVISAGPSDGLDGKAGTSSGAQQAATDEALEQTTTDTDGDESTTAEGSDETPVAETAQSRLAEPPPSPPVSPTAGTIPIPEPSATAGEAASPSEASAPAPGDAKGASEGVMAESADPMAPPRARPAPAAPRGYTIQVGAYRSKANAEAQMADLAQRGYAAYLFEVTDAQQRSFYMVRFGHFSSSAEAAESVAAFTEKEKIQAVIVRAGAM